MPDKQHHLSVNNMSDRLNGQAKEEKYLLDARMVLSPSGILRKPYQSVIQRIINYLTPTQKF